MEFNVNDKVRVKLTPIGKTIHAADHALFWASCGHPSPPEYQPPKEDADGWSEWQLWVLMEAFGKHMHIGCKLPFETAIELVTSTAKSEPTASGNSPQPPI